MCLHLTMFCSESVRKAVIVDGLRSGHNTRKHSGEIISLCHLRQWKTAYNLEAINNGLHLSIFNFQIKLSKYTFISIHAIYNGCFHEIIRKFKHSW